MTDDFKDISIRGRLAFGAKCVENALLHSNINNSLINELVLPRIWSFTTSTDFSVWEEDVNEIDPTTVLDVRLVVEPFELSTITFDVFQRLKEVYKNISADITNLISAVIEIGAGNLYGGTGKCSEITLKSLTNVIDCCLSLNVPLPKVDTFRKAHFLEKHGWGVERPKKYYLAD